MSDQGQLLGRLPTARSEEPSQGSSEGAADAKRWGVKLPSLRRGGTTAAVLGKVAREERAQEKERQKEAHSIETAKQAFFQTPAGRARLAYKRGHRLFQYELEVNELPATVIPGPVGTPARETTDPVDILNSVTVEGWKLVTGKFFHSEMRNGAVGCYLFKRSQKRRLPMNNPWQDLARLQRL
ncbi:MAG: hypothetical protein ACRDLL_07270 [Solirubrobacterales bacterium]